MELSLEEFSTLTAAIHTAAAYPERWPEALSTVARLAHSPGFGANGESGWANILASLDHLAITAFVVSGNGAVRDMNTCARNLVACDESLCVQDSQLCFSDPAPNSTFAAALRKATRPPYRSSLFPFRSAAQGVCEVNLSPLQHESDGASPISGGLALVVVTRPRPDADRIAPRVRRLFGLTDAEVRVMAALTLGQTVEQVAVAHGVRVSTVRAQVRSIFEKTGVHRQADLVRLALSAAPLISRTDGV
jgi:DNA-binding CsgD family transcriptional regulator